MDNLRMSVRKPGSLSRANGAYLVVGHFLRSWGLMKKKKLSNSDAWRRSVNVVGGRG